jgi:GNAT superfamily N-acetyltransferase
VSVPQTGEAWLELIRAGMAPFWRELVERAGGSVWARGGVQAAIFPRAPERSIFNSVFYENGVQLLESLEEISRAYDSAGVRAWTVWVPEADRSTAEGLAQAGHKFDAEPRAMGMEISELREPEPDETIVMRDELDMREVARLNEIAYGWPPGDFDAVAEAEMPGTYAHFASIDGETVGTVVSWDHGEDAEILWVATVPEARNRGVSRRLMARAISAAGERGRTTTTLVATKLGRPVYERLGYRDFGALHMWERRRPE